MDTNKTTATLAAILADKKKSRAVLVMILAAAVAILLPVFVSNSYIINLFVLTLIYCVLSSAWNILSGFAGQFGFSGLFFGLGAYICAGLYTTFGLTPWLGMLIAAVIASVIGLLMGFLTFPLKKTYFALATLALLNILQIVFSSYPEMLGVNFAGSAGLRIPWYGGFWDMQFVDKRVYYYIVLAILILTLLLCRHIAKSKSGFYFKAINTNQMAASSLGVNILKYKQYAQIMTAFIMGIIGGIYAMYMSYLDPNNMFSFTIAFNIMLMAMVGGRSSVFGPTIGALLIMPFSELLRLWFSSTLPGLPIALYGLILMLFVQFMPEGLLPFISEKRRARSIKNMQAAELSESSSVK